MVRTVHARFLNKKLVTKTDPFNKVISVIWSYDTDTSILRYGATVYHYSKKFWNKKEHRETALKRYEETPIEVLIVKKNDYNPRYVAMDRFIATSLIYKYGCSDVNGEPTRVENIGTNFNEIYFPEKKESEKQIQRWTEKEMKNELESSMCADIACMLIIPVITAGVFFFLFH
jgi:hypothetical protein